MRASPTPYIRAVAIWIALGATQVLGAAEANNAILESGRKLALEAKCEACHNRKIGGDGSAIYTRKDRRVTAKTKLLPQVARCNNELSLGLFPEDEAAIAAYLNATHYRFKDE